MPVIKHFTGNCHVYVDRAADIDMAERITVNAKCQRMGVCNAAESLSCIATWPPRSAGSRRSAAGAASKCAATAATRSLVPRPSRPAKRTSPRSIWEPIISVKVVDSLDEAIDHINRYGSHHTDAIVTARSGRRPAFAGRRG